MIARLYSFSVRSYGFMLRLASLFHPKARAWVNGRKNWRQNLPPKPKTPVIWFHCASLGEFDQGSPIMRAMKLKYPSYFFLITFFSPSGYQNFQKRENVADDVCYLPIDTPENATYFVNYFKPEFAFFVKYEFWSNYLFALKKNGTKTFLVSGLFRKKQHFFKWYGAWFRKTLLCFDHLFVQNERSLALLRKIKITHASWSGDTRFDSVQRSLEKAHPDKYIENFLGGEKAWIIGSSWPKDEDLLVKVINSKKFTRKVLIAPHDIRETHIEAIERSLMKSFSRYTDLERGVEHDQEDQVLILNTIGHLTNAYQYGEIAYVGGGFSGKLHNILEPATFGIPVIFGPKHGRFPEAQLFVEANIGFEISNAEILRKLMEDPGLYHPGMKDKVNKLMQEQQGATERIMAYLTKYDQKIKPNQI